MSVRLTSQENRVALFDSVTGMAFGPTFSSESEAQAFLDYLQRSYHRDARSIGQLSLRPIYERWISARLTEESE